MNLELRESVALRRALLAELGAYRPADRRERQDLERTRAFVSAEERCFDRATMPGHVTASCWIVDEARTATVMVFHRKHQSWVQPGGHADGDGDLRRVALREALEETGLRSLRFAQPDIYDIYVYDNPARGDKPAHVHYDIRFLFYADRDEAPVLSDESHDVAWIDFSDLRSVAPDDSINCLREKLTNHPRETLI